MSNALICRDFYGIILKVGDYVKPVEGTFKKMRTGYIHCIHQPKEPFTSFTKIDIVDERGNIISESVSAIGYTKEIPTKRNRMYSN